MDFFNVSFAAILRQLRQIFSTYARFQASYLHPLRSNPTTRLEITYFHEDGAVRMSVE